MTQILIVILGVIIQSIVLLSTYIKERPRALGLVGLCLAISSVFLLFKPQPTGYTLTNSLIAFTFSYIFFFSVIFLQRLIVPINERVILQMSIAALYSVYAFNISSTPLLLFILIPGIINLVFCFIDKILPVIAKAIFYGYFLALHVLILYNYFSANILSSVISNTAQKYSFYELFFTGAACFYLSTQLIYLFIFIFVPFGVRSKSDLIEVWKYFSDKNGNEQLKSRNTLLIIILQTTILFINYHFSLVSNLTLLSLSVILPSLIIRYSEPRLPSTTNT